MWEKPMMGDDSNQSEKEREIIAENTEWIKNSIIKARPLDADTQTPWGDWKKKKKRKRQKCRNIKAPENRKDNDLRLNVIHCTGRLVAIRFVAPDRTQFIFWFGVFASFFGGVFVCVFRDVVYIVSQNGNSISNKSRNGRESEEYGRNEPRTLLS